MESWIEVWLQWTGCLFGLAGSMLLALKGRHAGFGFALYLVSNSAWMAFGVTTGAAGLVVMQLGFSVTSVLGLWKWILAPRVATLQQHERGSPCNQEVATRKERAGRRSAIRVVSSR